MTIHELRVGESASRSKTITETDVYLFAGITGDLNPAHVNEQTASLTPFGGRIAHGILSAGLISAVLGMQFPAPAPSTWARSLSSPSPSVLVTPSPPPARCPNFSPKRTSPSWILFAPTSGARS